MLPKGFWGLALLDPSWILVKSWKTCLYLMRFLVDFGLQLDVIVCFKHYIFKSLKTVFESSIIYQSSIYLSSIYICVYVHMCGYSVYA